MRSIRLISVLLGMAVVAVSCMGDMTQGMPGHEDHRHLIVGHVTDTS